jgi:hypothetical protein
MSLFSPMQHTTSNKPEGFTKSKRPISVSIASPQSSQISISWPRSAAFIPATSDITA